jgi:hypothetical protein
MRETPRPGRLSRILTEKVPEVSERLEHDLHEREALVVVELAVLKGGQELVQGIMS